MTHRATQGRIDAILDRIAEGGGRRTATRRAIIETVLTGPHHTTAEAVAASVQARHPDVNLSTIYRTLETLESLGIVDHVHLDHGPTTWHVTTTPHHHLVCTRCGAVIEVPMEELVELHDRIERTYNFTADPHFALAGICSGCRDDPGASGHHH